MLHEDLMAPGTEPPPRPPPEPTVTKEELVARAAAYCPSRRALRALAPWTRVEDSRPPQERLGGLAPSGRASRTPSRFQERRPLDARRGTAILRNAVTAAKATLGKMDALLGQLFKVDDFAAFAKKRAEAKAAKKKG